MSTIPGGNSGNSTLNPNIDPNLDQNPSSSNPNTSGSSDRGVGTGVEGENTGNPQTSSFDTDGRPTAGEESNGRGGFRPFAFLGNAVAGISEFFGNRDSADDEVESGRMNDAHEAELAQTADGLLDDAQLAENHELRENGENVEVTESTQTNSANSANGLSYEEVLGHFRRVLGLIADIGQADNAGDFSTEALKRLGTLSFNEFRDRLLAMARLGDQAIMNNFRELFGQERSLYGQVVLSSDHEEFLWRVHQALGLLQTQEDQVNASLGVASSESDNSSSSEALASLSLESISRISIDAIRQFEWDLMQCNPGVFVMSKITGNENTLTELVELVRWGFQTHQNGVRDGEGNLRVSARKFFRLLRAINRCGQNLIPDDLRANVRQHLGAVGNWTNFSISTAELGGAYEATLASLDHLLSQRAVQDGNNEYYTELTTDLQLTKGYVKVDGELEELAEDQRPTSLVLQSGSRVPLWDASRLDEWQTVSTSDDFDTMIARMEGLYQAGLESADILESGIGSLARLAVVVLRSDYWSERAQGLSPARQERLINYRRFILRGLMYHIEQGQDLHKDLLTAADAISQAEIAEEIHSYFSELKAFFGRAIDVSLLDEKGTENSRGGLWVRVSHQLANYHEISTIFEDHLHGYAYDSYQSAISTIDGMIASYRMGDRSTTVRELDLISADHGWLREINDEELEAELSLQINSFLLGLEQAKNQLWNSYLNKGWLTRLVAQMEDIDSSMGDRADVRAGVEWLAAQLERTSSIDSLEGWFEFQESFLAQLDTELQVDGILHRAIDASGNDLRDHFLQIAESLIAISAFFATMNLGAGAALRLGGLLSRLGQGASRLAQVARVANQGLSSVTRTISTYKNISQIMKGAQQAGLVGRVLQSQRLLAMAKGFGIGGYVSGLNNLLRPIKDVDNSLLTLAKDVAATGLMGAVSAGVLHGVGKQVSDAVRRVRGAADQLGQQAQNAARSLVNRYFGDLGSSAKNIVFDLAMECVEEVGDAAIRKWMDNDASGLTVEELIETVTITGLGGFTNTGMLAELSRSAMGMGALAQRKRTVQEREFEAALEEIASGNEQEVSQQQSRRAEEQQQEQQQTEAQVEARAERTEQAQKEVRQNQTQQQELAAEQRSEEARIAEKEAQLDRAENGRVVRLNTAESDAVKEITNEDTDPKAESQTDDTIDLEAEAQSLESLSANQAVVTEVRRVANGGVVEHGTYIDLQGAAVFAGMAAKPGANYNNGHNFKSAADVAGYNSLRIEASSDQGNTGDGNQGDGSHQQGGNNQRFDGGRTSSDQKGKVESGTAQVKQGQALESGKEASSPTSQFVAAAAFGDLAYQVFRSMDRLIVKLDWNTINQVIGEAIRGIAALEAKEDLNFTDYNNSTKRLSAVHNYIRNWLGQFNQKLDEPLINTSQKQALLLVKAQFLFLEAEITSYLGVASLFAESAVIRNNLKTLGKNWDALDIISKTEIKKRLPITKEFAEVSNALFKRAQESISVLKTSDDFAFLKTDDLNALFADLERRQEIFSEFLKLLPDSKADKIDLNQLSIAVELLFKNQKATEIATDTPQTDPDQNTPTLDSLARDVKDEKSASRDILVSALGGLAELADVYNVADKLRMAGFQQVRDPDGDLYWKNRDDSRFYEVVTLGQTGKFILRQVGGLENIIWQNESEKTEEGNTGESQTLDVAEVAAGDTETTGAEPTGEFFPSSLVEAITNPQPGKRVTKHEQPSVLLFIEGGQTADIGPIPSIADLVTFTHAIHAGNIDPKTGVDVHTGRAAAERGNKCNVTYSASANTDSTGIQPKDLILTLKLGDLAKKGMPQVEAALQKIVNAIKTEAQKQWEAQQNGEVTAEARLDSPFFGWLFDKILGRQETKETKAQRERFDSANKQIRAIKEQNAKGFIKIIKNSYRSFATPAQKEFISLTHTLIEFFDIFPTYAAFDAYASQGTPSQKMDQAALGERGTKSLAKLAQGLKGKLQPLSAESFNELKEAVFQAGYDSGEKFSLREGTPNHLTTQIIAYLIQKVFTDFQEGQKIYLGNIQYGYPTRLSHRDEKKYPYLSFKPVAGALDKTAHFALAMTRNEDGSVFLEVGSDNLKVVVDGDGNLSKSTTVDQGPVEIKVVDNEGNVLYQTTLPAFEKRAEAHPTQPQFRDLIGMVKGLKLSRCFPPGSTQAGEITQKVEAAAKFLNKPKPHALDRYSLAAHHLTEAHQLLEGAPLSFGETRAEVRIATHIIGFYQQLAGIQALQVWNKDGAYTPSRGKNKVLPRLALAKMEEHLAQLEEILGSAASVHSPILQLAIRNIKPEIAKLKTGELDNKPAYYLPIEKDRPIINACLGYVLKRPQISPTTQKVFAQLTSALNKIQDAGTEFDRIRQHDAKEKWNQIANFVFQFKKGLERYAEVVSSPRLFWQHREALDARIASSELMHARDQGILVSERGEVNGFVAIMEKTGGTLSDRQKELVAHERLALICGIQAYYDAFAFFEDQLNRELSLASFRDDFGPAPNLKKEFGKTRDMQKALERLVLHIESNRSSFSGSDKVLIETFLEDARARDELLTELGFVGNIQPYAKSEKADKIRASIARVNLKEQAADIDPEDTTFNSPYYDGAQLPGDQAAKAVAGELVFDHLGNYVFDAANKYKGTPAEGISLDAETPLYKNYNIDGKTFVPTLIGSEDKQIYVLMEEGRPETLVVQTKDGDKITVTGNDKTMALAEMIANKDGEIIAEDGSLTELGSLLNDFILGNPNKETEARQEERKLTGIAVEHTQPIVYTADAHGKFHDIGCSPSVGDWVAITLLARQGKIGPDGILIHTGKGTAGNHVVVKLPEGALNNENSRQALTPNDLIVEVYTVDDVSSDLKPAVKAPRESRKVWVTSSGAISTRISEPKRETSAEVIKATIQAVNQTTQAGAQKIFESKTEKSAQFESSDFVLNSPYGDDVSKPADKPKEGGPNPQISERMLIDLNKLVSGPDRSRRKTIKPELVKSGDPRVAFLESILAIEDTALKEAALDNLGQLTKRYAGAFYHKTHRRQRLVAIKRCGLEDTGLDYGHTDYNPERTFTEDLNNLKSFLLAVQDPLLFSSEQLRYASEEFYYRGKSLTRSDWARIFPKFARIAGSQFGEPIFAALGDAIKKGFLRNEDQQSKTRGFNFDARLEVFTEAANAAVAEAKASLAKDPSALKKACLRVYWSLEVIFDHLIVNPIFPYLGAKATSRVLANFAKAPFYESFPAFDFRGSFSGRQDTLIFPIKVFEIWRQAFKSLNSSERENLPDDEKVRSVCDFFILANEITRMSHLADGVTSFGFVLDAFKLLLKRSDEGLLALARLDVDPESKKQLLQEIKNATFGGDTNQQAFIETFGNSVNNLAQKIRTKKAEGKDDAAIVEELIATANDSKVYSAVEPKPERPLPEVVVFARPKRASGLAGKPSTPVAKPVAAQQPSVVVDWEEATGGIRFVSSGLNLFLNPNAPQFSRSVSLKNKYDLLRKSEKTHEKDLLDLASAELTPAMKKAGNFLLGQVVTELTARGLEHNQTGLKQLIEILKKQNGVNNDFKAFLKKLVFAFGGNTRFFANDKTFIKAFKNRIEIGGLAKPVLSILKRIDKLCEDGRIDFAGFAEHILDTANLETYFPTDLMTKAESTASSDRVVAASTSKKAPKPKPPLDFEALPTLTIKKITSGRTTGSGPKAILGLGEYTKYLASIQSQDRTDIISFYKLKDTEVHVVAGKSRVNTKNEYTYISAVFTLKLVLWLFNQSTFSRDNHGFRKFAEAASQNGGDRQKNSYIKTLFDYFRQRHSGVAGNSDLEFGINKLIQNLADCFDRNPTDLTELTVYFEIDNPDFNPN